MLRKNKQRKETNKMTKIIEKRNYIILTIIIVIGVFLLLNVNKQREYSQTFNYFNHNIVVKIYENKDIFAGIDKIYKDYDKAYKGKNDKLLEEIISYGQSMYKETNGYVDISKKSLTDGQISDFETKINNLTSKSKDDLDLDSIIGGLATSDVIYYLESEGVKEYLISDDGDVTAGNYYDDGTFKVSINNPNNGEILEVVNLENKSMVTRSTSKKTESYMVNPIENKVTKKYDTLVIIADDVITATMLANALYLMDYEDGKDFIKDFDAGVYWYFDGKTETYKFDKYLGE